MRRRKYGPWEIAGIAVVSLSIFLGAMAIAEELSKETEPCEVGTECFSFGYGGKIVGYLTWHTGKFVFIGNADKSAEAFLTKFNALCKELGEK